MTGGGPRSAAWESAGKVSPAECIPSSGWRSALGSGAAAVSGKGMAAQ